MPFLSQFNISSYFTDLLRRRLGHFQRVDKLNIVEERSLRLIQQLALGGFSGRINRFCVLRGNVLVSGRPEFNKSFDSKAFSWSLCTTIEISIKRAT